MKSALTIDDFLPTLTATIRDNPSLIVSASPGAGKTTRLPPALIPLTPKKILVLEPRRIAAVAAAARIADENDWELGKEVGYQVRFDTRCTDTTKLIFLTEALLIRKLLQDPELSDVGCVILDEFHERSLHVDLALGALQELRALSRPDLKIVVMSATLNAGPLSKYLDDAPIVKVPGKIFPLQIRYDDKTSLLRTGPDFTERMRKLCLKALDENPEGDLLCFLPGQGEIERLKEALLDGANARGARIFTLHGRLTLTEQQLAIEPLRLEGSPEFQAKRKVVLATNVAESSLTVEGVRIVVDSGLARLAQIHPRTGFESLDLVRISKASATQRAGRAARTAPGTVYRAWTTHDELSMKDFETAEIFRTDLSEALLLLAGLGVSRFENFSWFEKPPEKALTKGRDFLIALGALSEQGALTNLGKQIRDLPVHPRLAKLLIMGKEKGWARSAAGLAALLSERDTRKNSSGSEIENDLLARWEDLQANRQSFRNQQVARVAEQLLRAVVIRPDTLDPEKKPDTWMNELLLEAYSDRLCRRRRPREPQAKMVQGRGVKLHPDSSVKNSEFFLALELTEGREISETTVFQAIGIPNVIIEKKILPLAKPCSHLEWEDEKDRFVILETKEWQGLSIAGENRRPARPDEISEHLNEVAWERWNRLLEEHEDLGQWLLRLSFLNKADARWKMPDEELLRKGLEMACFGETSLQALSNKDLVPFFEPLLEPEHREALARECPSSMVVPSGSRIKIRYSEEQGARIEVRLQELFGLKSAPKVAGQSLTLVLLGPNYRPVQVTRDLESFWKNGYPEVRKEMRVQYPKHSWPEDPLTAAPQAKGRPRQ